LCGCFCLRRITGLGGWADGLSGRYKVEGRNPDGSAYFGVARIVDDKGKVAITWTIKDTEFSGQGRVVGKVLTVEWGSDTPVIYQIQQDGQLQGTWANGRALDILTPIP
jgi:hypothetical protein